MFGKYKQLLASGRQWAIHAAARIFSICMLLGLSYARLGNWDMIFRNGRRLAVSIFVFIICFIVFEVLICIFYNWVKRLDFTKGTVRWKFPDVIGRHYMVFAFCVIFACWLPWLIVYYPGSVPHDGYVELNMFFGIEPLTNHHPWILTMCMGAIFSMGRAVSDSFGIFLIVLIFSLLEAFCYAVVCSKIRKWKVFDTANVIILLFYGVVPVFGAYAQAVIKDGIFTALFTDRNGS